MVSRVTCFWGHVFLVATPGDGHLMRPTQLMHLTFLVHFTWLLLKTLGCT